MEVKNFIPIEGVSQQKKNKKSKKANPLIS